MSKMFRIVMVMALAMTAAGCQSKEEKVAQKICDCSQPGLELNEKMKAAGTDQQKLGELIEEHEGVLAAMIKCQQEIEDDYADKLEDPAFADEVSNQIFKLCPDLAKEIMLPGMEPTAEAKAAEKICDCAQPGMTLRHKMEAAGTDQQQVQELLTEYEGALAQMLKCQEEIEEDYREEMQEESFNDKVANRMFMICPDIAMEITLPRTEPTAER